MSGDLSELRAVADALRTPRTRSPRRLDSTGTANLGLWSVAEQLRRSLVSSAMADGPAVADPGAIRRQVLRVVAGLELRDGETGPMPAHEWKGTELRFEESPGVWGKWVDLKGEKGEPGQGGVAVIKQQVAGTGNAWFPGGW